MSTPNCLRRPCPLCEGGTFRPEDAPPGVECPQCGGTSDIELTLDEVKQKLAEFLPSMLGQPCKAIGHTYHLGTPARYYFDREDKNCEYCNGTGTKATNFSLDGLLESMD